MIDTDLRCWLIEVNKCPCMSYSTGVTKKLVPLFFEDISKIMVDQKKDPKCDIVGLELLLECPMVREPQEFRKAEESGIKTCFPGDAHWTPAGHAVAADAVSSRIKQKKLLLDIRLKIYWITRRCSHS